MPAIFVSYHISKEKSFSFSFDMKKSFIFNFNEVFLPSVLTKTFRFTFDKTLLRAIVHFSLSLLKYFKFFTSETLKHLQIENVFRI